MTARTEDAIKYAVMGIAALAAVGGGGASLAHQSASNATRAEVAAMRQEFRAEHEAIKVRLRNLEREIVRLSTRLDSDGTR